MINELKLFCMPLQNGQLQLSILLAGTGTTVYSTEGVVSTNKVPIKQVDSAQGAVSTNTLN